MGSSVLFGALRSVLSCFGSGLGANSGSGRLKSLNASLGAQYLLLKPACGTLFERFKRFGNRDERTEYDDSISARCLRFYVLQGFRRRIRCQKIAVDFI